MKKLKSLNKMEWLMIAMIFTIVFGVLSNIWEWFIYLCAISFVYPFVLSLVMIGYAIKNTIKDL